MSNNILTLNEVNEFNDKLKRFIIEINNSIRNIELIIDYNNNETNLIPIKHFLNHYVNLAYLNCVINFYKIYSKNENFSFVKFSNKLKYLKYDIDLRQKLNENKELEENLISSKEDFKKVIGKVLSDIEKHNELITKLFNRRNKFYAHTDTSDMIPAEKFKELKGLLIFTIQNYRKVFENFYGIHFIFDVNISSIQQVLNDRKFVDDYYTNLENELEQN